ncbi:MAG: hypothetical protein IJF33_07390 [Clostridia bacterium]|nr:hypothetical protein [Clostridia bacterium]
MMKICSRCGAEISDQALICANCGCNVAKPVHATGVTTDKSSVALCIFSALIPLFGLIYWQAMYYKAPIRATECGMTAIISIPFHIAIAMMMFRFFQ